MSKEEKISITVETVKGDIELELSKSTGIEKIITTAVEHLGLGQPDAYELLYKGTAMARWATLWDYGVEDRGRLELGRITLVGF